MEPYRSSAPYRRNLPKEKKTSGTKRFVITTLLLLLLVGLGAGGVYGWQVWTNRAKLRDLQMQMASAFEEGGGPGRGDREKFRDLMRQVDELPDAYKREFRHGMREMFQSRRAQSMRDYLALDKDARRKELDRRIAEDAKRAQEREARRKERAAQAAKDGTSGSGSGRGDNQNGSNGQGGQGSGQNGQGPGGQGQGGPGGGRGLAGRLDNSSPQMRASMAEYGIDMRQRRTELGLPPLRHGGWGRR